MQEQQLDPNGNFRALDNTPASMEKYLGLSRTEDGTTWKRHVKQPTRNRRAPRFYKEFLIHQDISESTHELERASYSVTPTYIYLLNTSGDATWEQDVTVTTATAFYNTPFLPSRDNIIDRLQTILCPDFLQVTDNIDQLLQDFTAGSTVSVSDGSYYPDQGKAAAAWIIESSCRTQWIIGAITVPGDSTQFNSYRSELTGLLGISITLRLLATCTPQPRHCIIGCDGKAALKSLTTNKDDIGANSNNADIVSSISDIWISLDTQPLPIHIDGHQDQTQKQLNRLEKMNMLMDKLATMIAMYCRPRDSQWRIPFIGLRPIRHENKRLTGQVNQTLYHQLTTKALWSYFATRVFNNTTHQEQVNWKSLAYARMHATIGTNIFISKWISNTLPTGRVMQQRKQRIFNRCPWCNHWGEDREHIIRCWDNRAAIIWEAGVRKLQQTMTMEGTHPEIEQFLMNGLIQYNCSKNSMMRLETDVGWKVEQQQIGWMNFLSGFISNAMVEMQHQFYRTNGSRKSGHCWAGKIILQCWNVVYNMWLGRNEVLHRKKAINDISGEALLDLEIEKEYDLGYEGIPQSYHKWWTQYQKASLLSSSVEQKKGWLLVIKTIKESLQITEYSIFSSSRTLRNWIGLSSGDST